MRTWEHRCPVHGQIGVRLDAGIIDLGITPDPPLPEPEREPIVLLCGAPIDDVETVGGTRPCGLAVEIVETDG